MGTLITGFTSFWTGGITNKIFIFIVLGVVSLSIYFIDDYRYQLKENARLTVEVATQKEINDALKEANKREIRLSQIDLDIITSTLKDQSTLIEKRNKDISDIRKATQDAKKDPKQIVCVLDPGVKLAVERLRAFQFTLPNHSPN